MVASSAGWLVGKSFGWLVHWLVGVFIGRLVGSSAGWLDSSLVDSCPSCAATSSTGSPFMSSRLVGSCRQGRLVGKFVLSRLVGWLVHVEKGWLVSSRCQDWFFGCFML